MVIGIVIKKRFTNSLKKTLFYLNKNWGLKVATEFSLLVDQKIILITTRPEIGNKTAIKNTRSVLLGKGYQNKLYYKVEGNILVIVNLKDIRRDSKKNKYNL